MLWAFLMLIYNITTAVSGTNFDFSPFACLLYLLQRRKWHFVNQFCSFASTFHLLTLIMKLNTATFAVTIIPPKKSVYAHFFAIAISVTVDFPISFMEFQCALDEKSKLIHESCFPM